LLENGIVKNYAKKKTVSFDECFKNVPWAERPYC